MGKISWGKPTIKFQLLPETGVAGTTWKTMDTPKEGSTVLTVTEGEETSAKEEGGEIVARRRKSNEYSVELELFRKSDVERPFTDKNGVIEGEYAVQIIPEETGAIGIQFSRAIVSVTENYNAAEGILLKYKFSGLKPKTGNILSEVKGA